MDKDQITSLIDAAVLLLIAGLMYLSVREVRKWFRQ